MSVGKVLEVAAGPIASIFGANKNENASEEAARIQAQVAREALAEQKRIYDLESGKEEEQKRYDRAQTEEVKQSRRGAFGGFGNDLTTFSQGYAPVLGMSAEDSAGLLEGRNASARATSDRVPRPVKAYRGQGNGVDLPGTFPSMPTVTPGPSPLPQLPGPKVSGSFGSTVWLQAPTGEQMEVPIMEAQPMIEAGAILIPGPRG